MHTLGSLKTEIEALLGESLPNPKGFGLINDSIESLWESLLIARLSELLSGPVNLSLANASERAQVISLADPTSTLVVSNEPGGGVVLATFFPDTGDGLRTLGPSGGGLTAGAYVGKIVGGVNDIAFPPTAKGQSRKIKTNTTTLVTIDDNEPNFSPAYLLSASVVTTIFEPGQLPPRRLDFYYTLVTESGTSTLISPVTSWIVYFGNQLTRVVAPREVTGAIGWDLYVGIDQEPPVKQNEEPLPFSNAGADYFVHEPTTGWKHSPDSPPPPSKNTTGDDVFYIAHLELRTTDGGYKAWNQADLDSVLMRRAARILAGSSEYQSYYFDLIEGKTLELRPAIGTALNPRYFFIKKPRRLKFENAQIPFSSMPSLNFLKYNTISLVHLSNHEYEASRQWLSRAQSEEFKVMQSVLATGRGRDQRITPYIGA